MEGQPFFTTIAGLAISLAGFGAVIAWLRDDPSGWDAVNLWRVKTIVRHALTISFLCLSLIPIYTFVGDDVATVRYGSSLVALATTYDMWRNRDRDMVVWGDNASWWIFMTANGAVTLLAVANLFWASLGLLQVMVLTMLTSPAAIFLNFVGEMGHRKTPAPDPET